MSFRQKLWSVSFVAAPESAEKLASAFGDDTLAVCVLAPPRIKKAQVEAIYSEEPDRAALAARIAIITAAHKCKPPALSIKPLPMVDWVEKVAGDFPPLRIARWTVHGAHHRHKVLNRRYALQIDATSAFGTGEHPTTRGCLIMLDKMLKRKPPAKRMLDMGCGSGILAMAWAQTKHKRAIGIDIDPDSVRIAKSDLRANGLAKYVRIGVGYGYRTYLAKQHAPYDLIMANIFAVPLSHMAKDLKRHLRPGGKVILSGLLAHQANRVLAAHRMQKIYLAKRLNIGEWSILLCKHPSRKSR